MMDLIENAMIRRLRLASGPAVLGYTLRSISSYGEQLASENLANIISALPAVWVTFLGAQHVAGEDDHQWSARFVVIAAHRNARNEKASRLGAAGEVGVYQIANDIRGLFNDQQLGLPIDGLSPEAIRLIKSPVLAKNMVNVLAVEFTTGWYEGQTFDPPALITAENTAHAGDPDWIVRRQLGDFTTFNVAWGPPVPSDVNQTITLPPITPP